MNQRIRELAEQSGFGWALKRASLYGHDDDKQNLENFAELIIRECATAVAKANNPLGRNIDKLFEMHFGDKK